MRNSESFYANSRSPYTASYTDNDQLNQPMISHSSRKFSQYNLSPQKLLKNIITSEHLDVREMSSFKKQKSSFGISIDRVMEND